MQPDAESPLVEPVHPDLEPPQPGCTDLIQPSGGTPEAEWSAWPGYRDLPVLTAQLVAAGRPVVVLAAHPDDEVLGLGGLLTQLAARAADVRLVWATDGEASHPGSTAGPAATPARLAATRRDESAAALEVLGLGAAPRTQMGLPDGGLMALEDELVARLMRLVPAGAVILAPWSRDAHPDHEACGRAARRITECRADGSQTVEYPVWTWHWAHPDDPRVPWDLARRVDLDDDTVARKAQAIDCFASQIHPLGPAPADGPVLPEGVLAHFRRRYEVLLVTSRDAR